MEITQIAAARLVSARSTGTDPTIRMMRTIRVMRVTRMTMRTTTLPSGDGCSKMGDFIFGAPLLKGLLNGYVVWVLILLLPRVVAYCLASDLKNASHS